MEFERVVRDRSLENFMKHSVFKILIVLLDQLIFIINIIIYNY